MSGYGAWFILGVVATAVYLVMCLLFPFAACLRCKGDGRRRSFTGRSWRRCPRCKGSGERVRTGRRLWTWWSNTWTKGSR